MTDPVVPPPKPHKRTSPFKRAAITLGVLVLAVVLLLPVLVVATMGDRFGASLSPRFSNADKLKIAESTRAYTLPKDSSITPAMAGAAFHAIPAREQPTSFALKPRPPRPVAPWQDDSLPPELFPTAHTQLYSGPNPGNILEVVSRGPSKDEVEYLERIAHAPIWRDVEIVARAPAVDIIGGRFVLPFPDSAAYFEMPIIRFSATRELAYASVSRSAYYLAKKQNDSAEYALRVIPSLGFALIDNGTSAIDQLIGAVIVGIGREALINFYTITKNPSAQALRFARDSLLAVYTSHHTSPVNTQGVDRATLMAMVRDERLPRSSRFEVLNQLTILPCTNVRELLLGTRQDVDDTRAWAKKNLARYPSEVAMIDLASRMLTYDFSSRADDTAPGGFPVAVASLGSAITGNHRLVACMSLMAGMR
ncbi:MAG: hypothetical protein JWM95_5616 [Gemmatimonadetes bacterium]|nr:hypothetical protein [Gemmatimonadota bacterium]